MNKLKELLEGMIRHFQREKKTNEKLRKRLSYQQTGRSKLQPIAARTSHGENLTPNIRSDAFGASIT